MTITRTVFCFVFSEIENKFFFIRGLNLSVVNYQNHGKTHEKIKLNLCYRHYITGITLWTSHHGHYNIIMNIMTA